MVLPLSYLEQGQKAQIVWMALPPALECHLNALGLAAKGWVTCAQKGRDGGMSVYIVRRSVIALRTPEASKILVKLPSDRSAGNDHPGSEEQGLMRSLNDRSQNASCSSGRCLCALLQNGCCLSGLLQNG